MSWFWVPSDYAPPDACWHYHEFLNQFIDVINDCTALYNWSVSTGAAITDLAEVAAGDNVQSVSFWDSIQTRIELLIGVAINYDLVVDDLVITPTPPAVRGGVTKAVSLSETISSVEFKRFKDLANAVGGGTPSITTAHRFSTTPGDGFGWKRVDSTGAAAIGKIQAGDCINVQLFNQLYAACFVLQDFCIFESSPQYNDNWVKDNAYTGYMGTGTDTPECTDEFEACIRSGGESDPDPDAGYWEDPEDPGPPPSVETACGNARGVWATYWATLSLQDKDNASINSCHVQAARYHLWWCFPFEWRPATYYWEAYRSQIKADLTNLPVSPPLSIKQFGSIWGDWGIQFHVDDPHRRGISFCPWEYPSADHSTITDVTETTGHVAATLPGVVYPGATDNPANKAAPAGVFDVACDNHQEDACLMSGAEFVNREPWHEWSYEMQPHLAIKAEIPDPTRTEP